MKKTYTSREIIQMLKQDGWQLDRARGDHQQFKHSVKKGLVTVQHPVKDLSIFVVKSIFKQAGWIEKRG
jgi:predicted RNA binding protein YcfA (HicA-like mRNA interferase family)